MEWNMLSLPRHNAAESETSSLQHPVHPSTYPWTHESRREPVTQMQMSILNINLNSFWECMALWMGLRPPNERQEQADATEARRRGDGVGNECIDSALTSNDSISVEFFYARSRQRHNKVIFLFSFVFPQMNVKKGKWLYYKFFHNSILIIIIIWACITSVQCNIPDFVGGWLWLSLSESDCNSPGPNDKSDSSAQQNPLKNPPNCDCNRKDWRGAAADETEHP